MKYSNAEDKFQIEMDTLEKSRKDWFLFLSQKFSNFNYRSNFFLFLNLYLVFVFILAPVY